MPQPNKISISEVALDHERQRGITLPYDLRHPFWDGIRSTHPDRVIKTATPEITIIEEANTSEASRTNKP
jgi:hypothetical protein